MEQRPRKAGRPRKLPTKVKRATFSFRVTDRMRDQLAGAAGREGRSISEEIESRLERTFVEDLVLGESLHLKLAAQDVGRLVLLLETVTGLRVFGAGGDPWLHQTVWEAFNNWFRSTQPPGEAQMPAAVQAALADEVLALHTLSTLRVLRELARTEILTRKPDPDYLDRAQAEIARIDEELGEAFKGWHAMLDRRAEELGKAAGPRQPIQHDKTDQGDEPNPIRARPPRRRASKPKGDEDAGT